MQTQPEKSLIALVDLNAGKPNLGVTAIESRLQEAGLHWRRFEPRVEGSLPSTPIAGAILTGGPGSPMENEDWRSRTLDWLSVATSTIPILGICMGCQLLAAVHGWRLEELEHPRFGIYPLGLTHKGKVDTLLGPLPSNSTVFEQRRWGIFPGTGNPTGIALARTLDGEATALRFSPHVVGTIFHPEAAPAPVQAWLESDPAAHRKVLQRHGRRGLTQQISECTGLRPTWEMIIPGFLSQFRQASQS